MPTIVGAYEPASAIKSTTMILRYYRDFLRSDSTKYAKCARFTVSCRTVRDAQFYGGEMDRIQCRSWLKHIVNVAINRKAGIRDVACRKQQDDYYWQLRRDCYAVRAWLNHRVRFYGLETPELRRHYGHMISRRDGT